MITIDEITNEITSESTCPLCGNLYPHEHSAVEIICFRNGIKRGLAVAELKREETDE